MTLLEAIILGIVQGATEFLPVSSSGHLVIGQALLGLRLPGVTFEVAVHLATLLSIGLVYRERIVALLSGLARGESEARHMALALVLATIPAGVVGVGFGGTVEALFEDPRVTGVALLLTGGALWSTRRVIQRGLDYPLTLRMALLIGLAQAVAITPGISRSGATVVTALWLGMRPDRAAEFAFLLAIPASAGAGVLELGALRAGAGVGAEALIAGGIAAAVTGVLAIRLFLLLLRKAAFHRFAEYCWGVGVLFLAWLARS